MSKTYIDCSGVHEQEEEGSLMINSIKLYFSLH